MATPRDGFADTPGDIPPTQPITLFLKLLRSRAEQLCADRQGSR